MSHFLDRLMFFRRNAEAFSNGWGIVTRASRVNCTSPRSWRGCPSGASCSRCIYSAARLKHPLVRSRLLELWRQARRDMEPVAAWAWIVENSEHSSSYKSHRGRGGFVRARWEEVSELIAAANVYTIQRFGPDRIAGFSPIPTMSQMSFASGARYLSLIGGVIPSFYDWNCGLPPFSPRLASNPLEIAPAAEAVRIGTADYLARALERGELRMACEDPDSPENFPRVLFVWRADLRAQGAHLPREVRWRDPASEGKLDLAVTLDFRLSSNTLYSDVVLPTATGYEKDDLKATDMHPFIHPFNAAGQPLWESRTDWDIFKTLARAFSDLGGRHLGVCKDVVLTPLLHDTPGKTAPNVTVVERDYGAVYDRYVALGPLVESIGIGAKGISRDAAAEEAAS